jgi:ribonuclease-3
LEERIGYRFLRATLYETALTHSSHYNENRNTSSGCNERLEFLGDSVLGFLAAEYLYDKYEDKTEGELTRMRASLVCETSLAAVARVLGLSDALRLGKGEEMSGGRHRASLLADAVEAVLAAIYLDGGMEPARRFTRQFILDAGRVEKSDYKTRLQEVLQRDPPRQYTYHLVAQSGPDHAKVFTVEVRISDITAGRGSGGSKKEAEQAAAKSALEVLGETD